MAIHVDNCLNLTMTNCLTARIRSISDIKVTCFNVNPYYVVLRIMILLGRDQKYVYLS